jgi:hypothetical protein
MAYPPLPIFPSPYNQLYPNEPSFYPPPIYGPIYQPIAFSGPPLMMRPSAIIPPSPPPPPTASPSPVPAAKS